MRLRPLLTIALAATLVPALGACVSAHTAQHLETIERLASLRETRFAAAPLDPGRRVETQDCRQSFGPVVGNLSCE